MKNPVHRHHTEGKSDSLTERREDTPSLEHEVTTDTSCPEYKLGQYHECGDHEAMHTKPKKSCNVKLSHESGLTS